MTRKCKEKLVTFADLTGIDEGQSNEVFVFLDENKNRPIFGSYDRLIDMQEEFPLIPVRKQVADKLERAAMQLQRINSQLQLQVSYGYRSPMVQKCYFRQRSLKVFGRLLLSNEEKELVHKVIAVPEVAGHPTGGAIDIVIVNRESAKRLDMGTRLYDLEDPNLPTFSPSISPEQRENRNLLRKILMSEGFAPFDGEWWHFSYGDKEWAFYYGKKSSIYPQVGTI